jgi:membrane protein DedA with SNARE-associated domain
MKRFISLFILLSLLVITTFLLFSGLQIKMQAWINSTSSAWTYMVISFGLLTADILLPVPSSLLMILNGKMLGILAGSTLSLIASMTASLMGFFLGRKSTRFVNQFFSAKDIAIGNKLFNYYGSSFIAISKFIPVLSETISFISGCSEVSGNVFLFYSFIGNLFVSITYAFIGFFAFKYDSNILAGVVIGAILCITWLSGLITSKRIKNKTNFHHINSKEVMKEYE